MHFKILTIFPEFFTGILRTGLIAKAIDKGLLKITVIDIRNYTTDKHKKVDDIPYGGGSGMLMKVEPVYNCLKENVSDLRNSDVILFSPAGRKLDQKIFKEYSSKKEIIMICSRYEGVDERIVENIATDVLSIGDYIVQGGEVAATVFLEGVSRLLPSFLGNKESLKDESFNENVLEYPQYTRPGEFNNWKVPEILFSGNHKLIEEWRKEKSLERTKKFRNDLLKQEGE
jgi:tRNA (guanine37-N1)-methyltransferase